MLYSVSQATESRFHWVEFCGLSALRSEQYVGYKAVSFQFIREELGPQV